MAPVTGNRPGQARRVGLNTLALFVARLGSAALAVYQVSLIYPSLGTEHAGQYRAAFSFCAMFTVFASMGVHRVLFRDIARAPENAWPLVWSASALTLGLSLITYGGLIGVFMLADGDPDRGWAVAGAGLWVVVLWALQQPFEYFLMARERMVAVSALNLAVSLLKVIAIWLYLGEGATSFRAHMILSAGALLGLLIFVAAAVLLEGVQWPRISLKSLRGLFEASVPMSAIMLFSMIYFHADLVILTRIQGDVAGGIYGLVRQVTEPVLMLAGVIGNALFPALCRHATGDEAQFTALRQSSLRLLLLIALPVATGIAATALPIVQLLSRGEFEAFRPSVEVLRLACAVIPFFYFNGVALEVFLSNHQHWFVVRVYGAAAAACVLLNLFAAAHYGVWGAVAVAILVNAGITAAFALRLRRELGGLRLARFLPSIVIACTVMGAAAHALSSISFVAAVLCGLALFPAICLALTPFDARESRLLHGVLGRFAPRRLR